MEKPFKCSKCSQCFANNDHLAVHNCVLQVTIPARIVENVSETPTPTRFMRTSDVDGTQLFEEINPFDQDFSLASKGQKPASAGSNDKKTAGPLQTPVPIIPRTPAVSHTKRSEASDFTVSSTTTLENAAGVKRECVSLEKQQLQPQRAVVVQQVQPPEQDQQVEVEIVIQEPQEEEKQQQSSVRVQLPPATQKPDTAAIIALVQQQLLGADFQQQQEQKVQQEQQLQQQQLQFQEQQSNSSHELLREQLNKLIKSGQIKIQYSSSPSSTGVQATIVGTIASKQSNIKPNIIHNNIAPRIITSISTPLVSPLAALSATTNNVPTVAPVQNSETKDKLKQVLQQQSAARNMTDYTPRISMHSSNQGKYKDILLEDEMSIGQEYGSPGEDGRKRGRAGDDLSPDEKRRKFLERNRAAASRCRQKRKIWVNQLEKKSEDLIATNTELMTEIQNLRSEVAHLKGLLIAHKDCPVTIQQKSLMGELTSQGGSAYVTVSNGQIIAIHPLNAPVTTTASPSDVSTDEALATSALTDMATRGGVSESATVTLVQANDCAVTTISSNILG